MDRDVFGSLWAQCPISASGGMLALWEDGAQETGCMKGSQHHLCLAGVSKSFVFACSHISSMPNLGGRPILGVTSQSLYISGERSIRRRKTVRPPVFRRLSMLRASVSGDASAFAGVAAGHGGRAAEAHGWGLKSGDPSGWFGAPRFGFEPVLVGWESLQTHHRANQEAS